MIIIYYLLGLFSTSIIILLLKEQFKSIFQIVNNTYVKNKKFEYLYFIVLILKLIFIIWSLIRGGI